MCLRRAYKIGKKHGEVTCYKLLVKYHGEKEYVSPYKGMVYRVGEDFVADGQKEVYGNDLYEVDGGFLHTYGDFNSAVICTLKYVWFYDDATFDVVIAECTIPDGAEMYQGIFEDLPSYASECLHVNRLVGKEEVVSYYQEHGNSVGFSGVPLYNPVYMDLLKKKYAYEKKEG